MAASPVTTTTRLRALLMPVDGHPTYQAMLVQHTLDGPTIPSISSTHSHCKITIPDGHGGVTFSIFYTQLPPVRSNLNISVRSYLNERIFFGELVIFRVGSRGMRFVNLRSGDRAMAFKAATGLLDRLEESRLQRHRVPPYHVCPGVP